MSSSRPSYSSTVLPARHGSCWTALWISSTAAISACCDEAIDVETNRRHRGDLVSRIIGELDQTRSGDRDPGRQPGQLFQ